MANQTVYPYGTGGSLPSSVGIINDLKTGGADKALSAQQGVVLNEKISEPINPSAYSIDEAIINTMNKWQTISPPSPVLSKLVEIEKGNTYHIIAKNARAWFAVLASTSHTNNTSVQYATDYPTYYSVPQGTVMDVVVDDDSDAVCIYLRCDDVSGQPYEPVVIREGETVSQSAVIDNLVTDDPKSPLSARQGKILSEASGIDNSALDSLADVNLILIYGQSLSIGADTGSPISTTSKYKCNYKLGSTVIHTSQSASTLSSMELEPLTEDTVETPASGCAEKLIELVQQEIGLSCYSKYWNNKKFVYASCGTGSTGIANLMDTSGSLFSGLKNVISRVYDICVAADETMNVPAFIWIQGETDQKSGMAYSTYKTDLETLRQNIDTFVKSKNSQANDVKCVCYQTCSSNTVFGTGISGNNTLPITHSNALLKMAVPMAQMELVRDSGLFSAAAPSYCLDHNMNAINVTPANIHLTAIGSKMEGCIAAIALKRILFGESENNGVIPTTYSVSGNDIIIKYEANTRPLRIETEFVKEVENYGYKVINTSDNDIVSSVEVFDDSVTIHCSESPVGAIAVYGYNGVDGYDGRIKGGRGNICDKSGSIYSALIGNFHYLLNNYAFCFGFAVSSGTDNVITQAS